MYCEECSGLIVLRCSITAAMDSKADRPFSFLVFITERTAAYISVPHSERNPLVTLTRAECYCFWRIEEELKAARGRGGEVRPKSENQLDLPRQKRFGVGSVVRKLGGNGENSGRGYFYVIYYTKNLTI